MKYGQIIKILLGGIGGAILIQTIGWWGWIGVMLMVLSGDLVE